MRINSGCKVFTTSVLLQVNCTVMSDVILKGGDLLTQNCTSVTVGKNFFSNLMLANPLYVWEHTKVKITFKRNHTISHLTKPVNTNTSPHPL
jgi:hypothetical protein